MKGEYIISYIIIVCLEWGCTKPYVPDVIASSNNYLVVEGNINTGTDSTIIMLSRTVNISSGVNSIPELNATIAIQDDQNQSYNLNSRGNGRYVSPVLNLDPTREYRLNISTSDGKTYVSDYVPTMISPPIDSIGFTIQGNGIQIYVNTHDANNKTHYYRWDYTETWEFHAKYFSSYISNDTAIVIRQPSQYIYQCWTNDISTNIELGSSAKLSQDVIYEAPLVFIPSTSEKIETRYSILLKQYAMTTDGYNYYSLLKKNTEELGSIFDAQPSKLTGNIHCTTNPNLPVIGYVTAGSTQLKRVYIDNSQLPNHWNPTYPYNCELDTAFYSDHRFKGLNTVLEYLVPLPNSQIPISAIFEGSPNPVGFQYSDIDCVDCSVRGTLTKPSFWQ